MHHVVFNLWLLVTHSTANSSSLNPKCAQFPQAAIMTLPPPPLPPPPWARKPANRREHETHNLHEQYPTMDTRMQHAHHTRS
jgi:hypothetical protein